MEFIKGYQKDDKLRESYHELSQKIFGLNFEDWYQNGYWKENYIPYSIVNKDKIIVNVSVSPMEFKWKNSSLNLLQIGTVMTEESYRNKGLIRQLFSKINSDFSGITDGEFLFANNSVSDFYPKFGFSKRAEFQYFKNVCVTGKNQTTKIPIVNRNDFLLLENAIAKSALYSAFSHTNNLELVMFYVTKFMQNQVYYIENLNAYVIAEVDGNSLFLHNVFADTYMDLNEIISAFGSDINHVTLGFTPVDTTGYRVKEVLEDDTTLFVRGDFFSQLGNEKIIFPTLSHT